MTRKTGFVWHELYMWHNTGNYAGVMPTGLTVQPYEHAENPETKRRFKNLMDVAGLTDQLIEVSPRPATEQEVLMVHELDYLERVKLLMKQVVMLVCSLRWVSVLMTSPCCRWVG